jgi:hypothetical protein
MSATMARQGGQVQLEQSNMHLPLNMGNIAKAVISCAARGKMQYLINKPRAKFTEAKMMHVEFPKHKKVKAVMDRHPAMISQNHTDSCLPCPNGTRRIPKTPLVNHAALAEDCINDEDFDPELLTDDRTSCG